MKKLNVNKKSIFIKYKVNKIMKPIKPQKLEDIKIKGHNTFIKMGRVSDNGNNTIQKTGG